MGWYFITLENRMYRFFNKAIDYIGRKSPVLVSTPRADSLGNCAEEIFFGLLKARREGKKIIFLHPQNLVLRKYVANQRLVQLDILNVIPGRYFRQIAGWLLRNLIFRNFVANEKLFHIQSPYSIQNKYANFFGGWLLTLEIAIMWLCYRPWLWGLRRIRLRTLPKDAESVGFDFANMTPIIGRSSLWNPDGARSFSRAVVEDLNWRRQYEEYVFPRVMENDRRQGEQLRVQMGIPLADWFVCLHVRESGFRNDADIYRNASIKNYINGIEAITAAGGWVVRIGDSSMSPLPFMDHVIDYPHTSYKSELMDIYLVSQCRLYVGTISGPSEVATLFGKPTILINAPEWSFGFPLKRGDLSIIKHVFSRSRNRCLSIKEILEGHPWQVIGSGSSDYVMIENTPEEIRQVIEEFLDRPDDYEYTELQELFREDRKTQINRWLDQGETFRRAAPRDDLLQMYLVASRGDVASTLGQQYLEENWLVDSLENVP